MKAISIISLFGLLFSTSVLASSSEISNESTIGKITVKEITLNKESEKAAFELGAALQTIGSVIDVADKLVALGTKVWSIVEANRPVVSTDFAPAISVLPSGVTDDNSFYQMYGWSEPIIKSYLVEVQGSWGYNAISFQYSVIMQAQGVDSNGNGQYITGLTIVPSSLYVANGWTFNVSSKLSSIANKGTRDNPLASANLQMTYTAAHTWSTKQASVLVHVDGTGTMYQVNE